ncbi:hypothetical protein MtrunA17_Chr4g0014961 [Medicago truncatula]|uniref:Uncharacterized protein n=1 Tax=Medicago truncatula TaxID=3880 RepID=A0A396I1V8_MEDTR|nr:hypothetical protein MtrunA17_Chr4g0014961 [Medicago truncatula]
MVLEPLHDSLGHLLSGFRYRATRHLCSRFRCVILSVRGGVKSPTSVRSWSDNLFISGGNPHLISRFCGVVLSPTTISNSIRLFVFYIEMNNLGYFIWSKYFIFIYMC